MQGGRAAHQPQDLQVAVVAGGFDLQILLGLRMAQLSNYGILRSFVGFFKMDDIVIGSGCPCPCSLLESLRLNFRGGWPRPLRVQGLQQRHQRRQQQRHRAYHLAGEGQPWATDPGLGAQGKMWLCGAGWILTSGSDASSTVPQL